MDQPITNRDELILALKDAAELEQQFMCMYLYAAFSLKRAPDDSCGEAQLEYVRRWASTVYMIARQEMEHLSLVNSMLAAIGAPPHFTRDNLPAQSPHYRSEVLAARDRALGLANEEVPQPCDLPFLLEPFGLKSAHRYACMESAELHHLTKKEKQHVLKWCYKDQDGNCNCVSYPPANEAVPLHRSYYWSYKNPAALASNDVNVGTIEEMYDRIKAGFKTVASQDAALFVSPNAQHQVEVLSEYNIYIFPVTDLTSAENAIDLITRQGEGLGGAPGFDSHFLSFYEMSFQYEALVGTSGCGPAGDAAASSFNPALPVPHSPQAKDIRNPFTRQVFDLFNYTYVTLLYILTGLYGWFEPESAQSYPYLSSALREITFAPSMTMLMRSLGEVLVQLPLADDLQQCAGPDFYIPEQDDARLKIDFRDPSWQTDDKHAFYTDVYTYVKRLDYIVERLAALQEDLRAPEPVKGQLRYIYQSAYRIDGNLRRIYQVGVYEKFRTVS